MQIDETVQEYSSVSTVQYQKSTFKALYTAFVNAIISIFSFLNCCFGVGGGKYCLKKKAIDNDLS